MMGVRGNPVPAEGAVREASQAVTESGWTETLQRPGRAAYHSWWQRLELRLCHAGATKGAGNQAPTVPGGPRPNLAL